MVPPSTLRRYIQFPWLSKETSDLKSCGKVKDNLVQGRVLKDLVCREGWVWRGVITRALTWQTRKDTGIVVLKNSSLKLDFAPTYHMKTIWAILVQN